MEILDKAARYAVSHAHKGLVKHVFHRDRKCVGHRMRSGEHGHARLLGQLGRPNPIIVGRWANEGDIDTVLEQRGHVVAEVQANEACPHKRMSLHEGSNDQRGEEPGTVGQDPHP